MKKTNECAEHKFNVGWIKFDDKVISV